jgi:hypothetical protein
MENLADILKESKIKEKDTEEVKKELKSKEYLESIEAKGGA